MFILIELQDTVKVPPASFADLRSHIVAELRRLYVNKVLNDVGLCCGVYDLVDCRDAMVYHGDGSCHVRVRARLIVFRPSVGEVLIGTVHSSSEAMGLRVSLGFTNEIIIPSYNLPKPSLWSPEEALYAWHFGGTELWMNEGDQIRFRVEDIRFNPPMKFKVKATSPTPSPSGSSSSSSTSSAAPGGALAAAVSAATAAAGGSSNAGAAAGVAAAASKKQPDEQPPMLIIGSAAEQGFGMTAWWGADSSSSQQ